jgi:O-antigen ligase
MTGSARTTLSRLLGRESASRHADWLAVAVAVALPWSTSLTIIFIGLWLIALLGSLEIRSMRDEILTPAGGLPVALWALGVVGMLWAGAPMAERIDGLNGFHKLLAIPFLIAQFRRSDRGIFVLIGFLASCTLLLIVSWGLVLLPDLPWRGRERMGPAGVGIPVKDNITQSIMFTLCVFGLAEGAFRGWRETRRRLAFALLLLALLFLANILYISTSRTALVMIPILLLLFVIMRLGWKAAAGAAVAIIVLAAVVWASSPFLRERVTTVYENVLTYQPNAMSTPGGERLDFWRNSLVFIADAPVLGHGTGSIREQFRQLGSGRIGMATNPHNQALAIAIQLGLVGAIVLFAMWITHLRLFFRPGLAAGIGVAVVVQNVVSSLFNSSLFDFAEGWAYVWGVGVLCAMTLRAQGTQPVSGQKSAVSDTAGLRSSTG